MRKLFLLVLACVSALTALAGETVAVDRLGGGPSLARQTKNGNLMISDVATAQSVDLTQASIIYDTADALVVGKAARLLAQDIHAVTGADIPVNTRKSSRQLVIIGTVGQSRYIDELVKGGLLDVSAIDGGWERYVIRTIDLGLGGGASSRDLGLGGGASSRDLGLGGGASSPRHSDRAIVIAGSDRRGTAYGVFALSEAIGVNPWYWWADVPVSKREQLYVNADYTSREPSIKYRGIFINDEDWGLKPWSSLTCEPELGDIGPRTYARVCELLLRLRGNMLAPAMHSCTGAFYSHPESKEVADSFAIIITTSHCEPLLLNNAAREDWDSDIDGPWDYGRNPEGIRARWDRRLSEAACYENIYTMAMRGLHDEGMRGGYTMDEKVPLIERVIADQRAMLSRHTGRNAEDIPQIFVPYKETMDLYENGLQVPDDITLVWVDDNYGYMKRVSSPEEQRRSGASGVYYHTSYLGTPHDYLWLNTTPPALMYAELKKAYDTGADRYWLLNVGDIKPCELGMTTFFDLAWDVDSYGYDNINRHQAQYVADLFGPGLGGGPSPARHSDGADELQCLLDEYYRLAWSRKPEYMGWEREWDNPMLERLQDTDFSFDNYNDAQQRLADYAALSDRAAAMLDALPGEYQPAFFEMVAYPATGACQMNRKFLYAQLNHRLYADGDLAGANWAAAQSVAANDSINALNDRYNNLLDGKWRHMMSIPPGFCAQYQGMPSLSVTEGVGAVPSPLAAVSPDRSVLHGCTVLDLTSLVCTTPGHVAQASSLCPTPCHMCPTPCHDVTLIEGIGYDWRCVQLGDPVQTYAAPVEIEYAFSTDAPCDSVEVTVYALPLWPVYEERDTRLGVAVDGGEMAVFANHPVEWSHDWKTQVLQNAAVYTSRYPVDTSTSTHTLRLTALDPGAIIQRIVIDWGGLRPTYVGPRLNP